MFRSKILIENRNLRLKRKTVLRRNYSQSSKLWSERNINYGNNSKKLEVLRQKKIFSIFF